MSNQTNWLIDQTKSIISFKVNPLIFAAVKGTFRTFDAKTCTTDNDFKTIEINLWIDASSIVTGDMERDEHLKSADFFDVKKFNLITFVSTKVNMLGFGGVHELWGDLTIKGITKEIKTEVHFGGIIKDSSGKESAEFVITGKINRKEWGLIWSKTEIGGLMESEEVNISCEITLINGGPKD